VKKLRLVLSEAVAADIVEQADWYEEQSGPTLAQRWETAVTSTLLRVVENPQAGSLCTFSHAELSNVRRVLIPGFPKHLVFYRLRGAEIFVLRVLHGARDLESLF
jgi:toxin ParE1/3/4